MSTLADLAAAKREFHKLLTDIREHPEWDADEKRTAIRKAVAACPRQIAEPVITDLAMEDAIKATYPQLQKAAPFSPGPAAQSRQVSAPAGHISGGEGKAGQPNALANLAGIPQAGEDEPPKLTVLPWVHGGNPIFR